jgi:hypothetical protein
LGTILIVLCLPSFQPGRSVHSEDPGGRGKRNPGGPRLAHTTMVAGLAGPTDRCSSRSSTGVEISRRTNGPFPPIAKVAIDPLQLVREALIAKNVPDPAADIIMRSWRQGTKKQYGVYLRKWQTFCGINNVDMTTTRVTDVLGFLASLVESGLGYSAINTARGALTALLTISKRDTVGNHPLVVRFMKGLFESCPPQPRYTTTWDVATVLTHLKTLSPVRRLTLKKLTLKLTMLLALVTAQRIQTLQLLDLDCLTRGKRFSFTFREPLKHSRQGKPAVTLELLPYPPDRRLCILTVLNEYVLRTTACRGSETALLISFTRPHRKVSRDTIARWLRTVMAEAGVDTNVFKAHSTRAAVTSKAASLHVPIDQILKVGGWSAAGTFGTFYNKPVEVKQFATTVLQN